MLAKDVMTNNPEYLPPTASIKQAADIMSSRDFGFIPVGEDDRLIGAVTDRDITIRAVAKGKDPSKTSLKDIMSEGIQYCFEDEDLTAVARKMETLQIRRLVVLNKNKRMVGILALGDIATKCQDNELSGEVTEAVSRH